jgi:hypothetical protein
MNGVRTLGALLERLLKTLLVELVDGVARGLGVTAKLCGYLIGVFAIATGKQDLTTAQGEGIRRA